MRTPAACLQGPAEEKPADRQCLPALQLRLGLRDPSLRPVLSLFLSPCSGGRCCHPPSCLFSRATWGAGEWGAWCLLLLPQISKSLFPRIVLSENVWSWPPFSMPFAPAASQGTAPSYCDSLPANLLLPVLRLHQPAVHTESEGPFTHTGPLVTLLLEL